MLAVQSDTMSIIATLRFNWLPQPALYAQARAWTDRQQALRQSEEFQSAISDSLATAATDQFQRTVSIAAQVALKRTQAAAKAKVESALNPPVVSSPPSRSDRVTAFRGPSGPAGFAARRAPVPFHGKQFVTILA